MQWILAAWCLGCLAYVLIFLNVNYIHNYYQMPLVPMLAIAIAHGLDRLVAGITRLLPPKSHSAFNLPGAIVAAALIAPFCAAQVYGSHAILRDYDAHPGHERWYPGLSKYWAVMEPPHSPDLIRMGRQIHEQLPDNGGLLALAGDGMVADVRDPQMLYYVDRRGFVIHASDDAMEEIKQTLRDEVRAGRFPLKGYGVENRRRKYAWIDAHMIEFVERAIEKDIRTLVVVRAGTLLSAGTMAELQRRYRLHHAAPRGAFVIFDLTAPGS
ncbi:MAG: hypothetical protein V3T70_03290 [Phycisphaerae bacterium]